jgi:thioredoxin-like negative regulator of GroEL
MASSSSSSRSGNQRSGSSGSGSKSSGGSKGRDKSSYKGGSKSGSKGGSKSSYKGGSKSSYKGGSKSSYKGGSKSGSKGGYKGGSKRGTSAREGGRGSDSSGGSGRDGRSSDSRGGRSSGGSSDERRRGSGGPRRVGPKTWGGVARRGAGSLPSGETASDVWADTVDTSRDDRPPPADHVAEEWADQQWVRVDVADEAEQAVGRGRQTNPASEIVEPSGDTPALDELVVDVGPMRAPKLAKRLQDAARSFDREYYEEARRMLKTLAEQAPGAPSVRELYGLTLYRLGRWKLAAGELEAFRELAGTTEQNPVLADCYRALKRYGRVEELWHDLRQASPSAALVTEGRIVMAGAMADQGRLSDAIEVLAGGWKFPKNPQDHHLRRAYALADLYDRAGEAPRARELFRRIQRVDPRFADVQKRVRALG